MNTCNTAPKTFCSDANAMTISSLYNNVRSTQINGETNLKVGTIMKICTCLKNKKENINKYAL